MDSRGTLYRCNLFSFSGPRTEGVISSWKQNLESIGDREILSGEIVELMAIVVASTRTLNTNTHVRFDIFDKDFLLTSDSHDRITSIVGTGACGPDENITVHNVTTHFASLDDERIVANYIRNFKRTYPQTYQDNILILEHQRDRELTYLIVAWWPAKPVSGLTNSAFYFTINIDEEVEDRSEEILRVSSIQAPVEKEPIEAGIISGPDLTDAPLLESVFDVRWAIDRFPITARPDETVNVEASYVAGYVPTNGRFILLVDASIGHEVVSMEPEIGEGVLQASWTVALPRDLSAPARFKLIYSDKDDKVLATERLEILDRLEATILNENGDPLVNRVWTAKLLGGEKVYRGVTDQNGHLLQDNALAGRYELEIEGGILLPDEATRRSTLAAEEAKTAAALEDNAHNVVFTFGISPTGLANIETSLDPLVHE